MRSLGPTPSFHCLYRVLWLLVAVDPSYQFLSVIFLKVIVTREKARNLLYRRAEILLCRAQRQFC